ncbi:hypothetical protein [Agarivorans sp. Alg241-V36]|uniref:hypothetical protein n=1 Tax=Agarivorans sp. Alg241-V36 TaxID=2305992 RepID=UPI0013D77DF7|nr:hypothetical protein [Agarivorans sp. Alg241-V36]
MEEGISGLTMKRKELQLNQRKSKCKTWAQERVDGSLGYRDMRQLRTKLIEKLSANLAKDFDLNIHNVREHLKTHMPSFEFEYPYPDTEVDVAKALLSYLDGEDPFKRKPGKRTVKQQVHYAALFAWLATDNLSATAILFSKDISSFKRDMGTFAEDIDVRLNENKDDNMTSYQRKMTYFSELRNVGGNTAIMERAKQYFIAYMDMHHIEQWEEWIKSNKRS